jgi:hypothetical protein
MLVLENFSGFELTANPFEKFNRLGGELEIAETNFEFISSGIPLRDECESTNISNNKPLLASFQKVIFDLSVTFENNTCPLVFKDANILNLIISDISDSNSLNFKSVNILGELNSTIASYEIYKSSITSMKSSLLNEMVFKRLNKLVFESLESLVKIEADLFRPFKFLKEFNLRVSNLEQFLKQTSGLWLDSLNADLNVDLTDDSLIAANSARQMRLVLEDLSEAYKFPNEDLCEFINFPHSHLVYPVIETANDIECSCTLVWLTQYYSKYSEISELLTPSVRKCNHGTPDFDQLFLDCDFKNLTQQLGCDPTTSTATTVIFTGTTTTDTTYTSTATPVISTATTTTTTTETLSTDTSTPMTTITIAALSTSTTATTSLKKQCKFILEAGILECNEITSLTSLDTDDATDAEQIRTVFIRAKDPIRFKSFTFSGSETYFADNFELLLDNFDGFDSNANPFDKFTRQGGVLEISDTNFEFFSVAHDTSLVNVCALVKPLTYKSLISSFNTIILGVRTNFTQKICPLTFINSNIKRFVVSKIDEKNNFEFATLTPLANQTGDLPMLLNSTIQTFEIYQSYLKNITTSLLDENVFVKLNKFVLHAMNNDVHIHPNLFESFKFLREFHLFVPNYADFVQISNFDFLSSINSDVNVDLTSQAALESTTNREKQFKLKITDSSRMYTFPDEDLCDYIDFPHSRLIFPSLDSDSNLPCTCTIVYLTQYYPFYKDINDLITPSVANCNFINKTIFNQLIETCKPKFNECKTTPIVPTLTDQTSTTPDINTATTPIVSTPPGQTSTTPVVNTATTPIVSTPTDQASTTPVINTATIPIVPTQTDQTFTTPVITTTKAPNIIIQPAGLDGGAIAGIVIGSLGAVTIITIGGYFLYKFTKKSKVMPGDNQEMEKL